MLDLTMKPNLSKDNGGIIVKIERPSIKKIETSDHISENGISSKFNRYYNIK